ncbi:MAG: tetratricopeptide repeat protein [Caldilineaceae bacterium]|nr:tetratricopeptide repeat protein [Caldilineaceae bacterium]
MYLDRTYRPRRRRRGLGRFWPLIVLAVLAIILYEQQPAWLAPRSYAPTAIPTRSAISFLADADIAYRSGNIDAAIAAYEQVMRLEPANPKPLAQLSSLYLILQDLDKSRALAEQAVALAPKDPEALNALARILDWQGEYEDAANYAMDALEIDPNNATALAILGEIYTDVGNWNGAEDYLQQAVDLDPENVMALRNWAFLYEMRGDYEAAIAAYDRAIAVAPYRFDLYMGRGRQYRVGLQDFEKAIEDYRKAVEVYAAPVTLDTLGDGLYYYGDFLGAVRELRKAIELDPTYGPAQVHLGMALYARRNYEDAAAALETGLALVGDKARIEQIYTLGLAHIYKDPTECDKALVWLRKALEIDPQSGPALEGLSLCQQPH